MSKKKVVQVTVIVLLFIVIIGVFILYPGYNIVDTNIDGATKDLDRRLADIQNKFDKKLIVADKSKDTYKIIVLEEFPKVTQDFAESINRGDGPEIVARFRFVLYGTQYARELRKLESKIEAIDVTKEK